MKQLFFYTCCFSMVYLLSLKDLRAETNSPSICTKEELLKFFPHPIVKDVLIKDANLSEADAEAISNELGKKDEGLTKLVDEKASQFKPNPLTDSSRRNQAVKIYQETLFEVFAGVLKNYGVKDEQQVATLLEEIRSLKSKMFIDCIRQEQLSLQKP